MRKSILKKATLNCVFLEQKDDSNQMVIINVSEKVYLKMKYCIKEVVPNF